MDVLLRKVESTEWDGCGFVICRSLFPFFQHWDSIREYVDSISGCGIAYFDKCDRDETGTAESTDGFGYKPYMSLGRGSNEQLTIHDYSGQ